MNTILYATNRTEKAVPALRYAHDLSNRFGADLIVLYVHQTPPIWDSVTRLPDQMELQVIEEQKDILRAYCTKHLGNNIDNTRIQLSVISNDSILGGIVKNRRKYRQISP